MIIMKKKVMSQLISYILFFAVIFQGFIFIGKPMQAQAASLGIKANVSVSSMYVGGNLTVQATASGGSSPYNYKFIYKVGNGGWQVAKYYGSYNKVSFTTKTAGTYTVRSYAKDKKNLEAYCDIKVTVKPKYVALSNNSSINSYTVEYGTAVVINGKASGGNAPYTYAFYQTIQDGTKKTIKNFSSASSTSIKLSPGYYKIECAVKDKDGKTATKAFNNVTVKKRNTAALKNISTLPTSVIAVGSSLKITGKASGGYQPYQYASYYSLDGKTYTKISDYNKSAYSTVKLSKPGFYTIKTLVKDIAGKVDTKLINLTVKKDTGKIMTLSSSVNVGLLVDQGATATVKATAYGGSQPYKYAYYYKIDSGSWQVLKTFSTDLSAQYKFSNKGHYTLKVTARDATGKTIDKTFSVDSIAVSSYTASGVNKGTKNVNYGFSVTLNAQNKGTESQYAFFYKKVGTNVWSTLQNYSSKQTAVFRPRYTDKYLVLIYTKVGTTLYPATYYVTSSIDPRINKTLNLINSERNKACLKPVALDTDLIFVCGVRAEELSKVYSHTRPNGSSYSTVLDEYDADYSTRSGENIAAGFSSADDTVEGWMASAKHKANILNPNYSKMGVNIYNKFWDQIFTD